MRYPERKGMTEINAYLQNEGKLICEECLRNLTKQHFLLLLKKLVSQKGLLKNGYTYIEFLCKI